MSETYVRVSATSRPPLRLWGWPAWGWVALGVAAVATLAYEGYALMWLALGASADHPPREDVSTIQNAARSLTLSVLVPWLLAAAVVRPHVRVAVTALVCAVPAIWFWWEVTRTP